MNQNFISNCINRIIKAECTNRNITQRADDIAEAVRVAAFGTIEIAHDYLIRLCDAAEAGKYAK